MRSQIRRLLVNALSVPSILEPFQFEKKVLFIPAISDVQIQEIKITLEENKNLDAKSALISKSIETLARLQANYLKKYIQEITLNQVIPFISEFKIEKRIGSSPFGLKIEVGVWEADVEKLFFAVQIHTQHKQIMELEEQLDSLEEQIAAQKNENAKKSYSIMEYTSLKMLGLRTDLPSYSTFKRSDFFYNTTIVEEVAPFKSYLPNQCYEIPLENSIELKIKNLQEEIAQAEIELQAYINRNKELKKEEADLIETEPNLSNDQESGKSEEESPSLTP